MVFAVLAVLCAGLFAGAAVYVTFVEHPARLACGTAAAVAEFRPSYRRGAVMQAGLAAIGTLAGLGAWLQGQGVPMLVGAILLGSMIPFTLTAILPTNKRLLDPALDAAGAEARALLARWGALHAVRSAAGAAAFAVLVVGLRRAL